MGFVPSYLQCFLLFCVVNFALAFAESTGSSALAPAVKSSNSSMSTFRQLYLRVLPREIKLWEMALYSSVPLFVFWLAQRWRSSGLRALESTGDGNDRSKKRRIVDKSVDDKTEDAESGLLKKHSRLQTYSTSRYEYPDLRIFYRVHPQFDKLPVDPAPLPLLVFIHGLGGSVAQFDPLLTSLINVASSLAIDLPGCGLSAFKRTEWNAYKLENLAELLSVIIADHRVAGQGVVLIGHSLGCSLAALVASKIDPLPNSVAKDVIGIVAICPRAEPPSEEEVAMFTKLLWIPSPIFDLWRRWDRRGGKDSVSVQRFVGPDADETTKVLQYRFNEQSKTPVWRRMAAGTVPKYEQGIAKGGLPGKDVWASLHIPMFLVAGEDDNVTKPENIYKIASFLGKGSSELDASRDSQSITNSVTSVNTRLRRKLGPQRTISSIRAQDFIVNNETVTDDPDHKPSTSNGTSSAQPYVPKKTLKTTIIPKPASHAMLYQPASVRILAGLIFDFLSKQISPRLDLGWQLQYLSSSGKWDVKNLEKWKAVPPVSEPINNIFRAMKTLREVDETHSSIVFSKDWGDEIKDIVDISHEAPVYDPRNLSKTGITYHKIPTVSKIPPTEPEVAEFIRIIDDIRASQPARRVSDKWGEGQIYIGVHCHYGFNRTGFFIACYLVERCGYSVNRAIEEFKGKRPKGIKHAHFLNELFVRYCRGLKRAPTL